MKYRYINYRNFTFFYCVIPYGKWHSVAVTWCSITAIQLLFTSCEATQGKIHSKPHSTSMSHWATEDSYIQSAPLLANSTVERCRTDDLMPNVPISCLPSSRVDPIQCIVIQCHLEVPFVVRWCYHTLTIKRTEEAKNDWLKRVGERAGMNAEAWPSCKILCGHCMQPEMRH